VISHISVEVPAVYKCSGHGVDCCAEENGGIINGRRSGDTDDECKVRKEVG
jgi:hypothetical protein